MKVVTRRVSSGNCCGVVVVVVVSSGKFLLDVVGRKQEQIYGAYRVYRPEMLDCW